MPDAATIRPFLAQAVANAVRAAIAAGELPEVELTGNLVERPRDATNGDFATTLAMRLARAVMKPPPEVARTIIRYLDGAGIIEPPDVAGPGFINFRLTDAFVQDQVNVVIAQDKAFGAVDVGNGQSVQVEFVSANPTGPLHVGNARGAAIGDTLAALLAAAGYAVQREYYVNDAGTQAETFGATLFARYQQQFGLEVDIPSDGYPGDYMIDLAAQIKAEAGDRYLGEAVPSEMVERGLALMVERIRASLGAFGVHYDRWYSERSLFEPGGPYEQTMAVLRERGYLVERDGALWFASTELGETKDNVLVRSDGRPTYYASDIAYHYDKFVHRGFNRVIDIWGADHHGHVSRMKAATNGFGGDPDALHILLYQLVTLKRGNEAVRLSKRGGEIITIEDLIEEVGADAARFFFLQRSPGAQMDFDLELAARQSSENPVYYVQYAHARLCSILERAQDDGLSADDGDVRLLTQPHELALVREIMRLPEVIEYSVERLETQEVPQYAMSLASTFTAFNDAPRQQGDQALRVITDDRALSAARLRLVLATKVALARVLGLMGMSAPEHM